ncbi:PepSY domain-containing protein [Aquimarina sp. U1-2]|uniref:PepSY-associated TM helix domain-containing protein n=1 Tax=Aquimarina sp. U1-2 TaxID=2823141 RepID=UPI001AECC977|nr:PepSY-associated TM helix domain-containing protein [Aquimarina sp. U1-2]MBP2832380.1 PepSY domain-containing protein [Aquimarina sp. U1-2]
MKLKALKPRLHNIVFHTHTVSGIVISFALFIIFYAGAVALFMEELYPWENPEARFEAPPPTDVDYDRILTIIQNENPNFDTSYRFSLVPPKKTDPFVHLYGYQKTTDGTSERFEAQIHPITYKIHTTGEPKTHMARTLYELHFFHQIPVAGLYISGFVAFFFLFAIITGVLTHWKNIITKFYAFTVKGKWKQIWTNGHVSLGFIALPFQIIYAVTGALLGLSILLLAPSAFLMFDGDTNEIIKAVRPDAGITYDKNAKVIEGQVSLNSIYSELTETYPNKEVTLLYSTNFGKEDGTVNARIDDLTGIAGDGIFVYSYKTGELLQAVQPDDKSYSEGAYGVLIKLHYATYGGLFLKIIYFILAMITCYIIISGVMIWRTARDNKRYTEAQRRFHHRVTKVYLAITLSMFPALALIFIANKIVPLAVADRIVYVNTIFFLGWLSLSIAGLYWNNYRALNRNYILIGGVLGLLIPVANGLVTGDWIWITLVNQQYYIFCVDMTWLIIGISSLLFCFSYSKLKDETKNQSSSDKEKKNTKSKTHVKPPTPVLQNFVKN